MTGESWLALGAILGGLAVGMGAFGAHGLEGQLRKQAAEAGTTEATALVERRLANFETAAKYQMYHALAILVVGVLLARGPSASAQVAGVSFVIGVFLFSGSLYTLVITGKTWWGMVTPFGGVAFLVGWAALAAAAFSTRR